MENNLYTTLKYVVLIVLIISVELYSQNISANPTRPSAADNAFLTEYGYTEIELGFSGQTNYSSVPLLLKFSAIQNGEFGFIMNGLVNSSTTGGKTETKVGDPGLQFKYQFINNGTTALALVGKTDFIPGNTKFTIYAVPSFITQYGQIDATAGLSIISRATSVFYAIAFSPKVNLPFGFYVELFGETAENYSPIYFDAGISYPVSTDFVIDAAIVWGLNDEATDWQYQIGFTKSLFEIF